MAWWQVLIYAEGAFVLALAGRGLHRGYMRRRPHWTRGSWLRFAAVCVTGFFLAATPVLTELAINRELLTRQGLSADARGLWALATVAVMLLGGLVFVGSIGWFAQGDPTRQFPGAGSKTP